jgi:hypothetical protein
MITTSFIYKGLTRCCNANIKLDITSPNTLCANCEEIIIGVRLGGKEKVQYISK